MYLIKIYLRKHGKFYLATHPCGDKSLRRSAISPHNYTLKWFLLLDHNLVINYYEKFRLGYKNKKIINYNFYSLDFRENIFQANCTVAKSNLWKY